ncbi:TPA: hypothetical protein ACH3X1_010237 [Trebouxia sp. C0004]
MFTVKRSSGKEDVSCEQHGGAQHAHGQQQVLQCLRTVAMPAVAIYLDIKCRLWTLPSLTLFKPIIHETHFFICRAYSCTPQSIVGHMMCWICLHDAIPF